MATENQSQQSIPAIPAATSQRTMLRSQISTGGLNAVEDIKDLPSAIKTLEIDFAQLRQLIEGKLVQRHRDFAEPVRIVDDTLKINEDGMLPEVTYGVTWNGEHYQIMKGLDGAVRLFEVTVA